MTYIVKQDGPIDLTLNEKDETAAILQNVQIILATLRGSVPLYRDFGISSEHFGKPLTTVVPMLFAQIKEAIETYEPRVELIQIDLESSISETGTIVPAVEVSIIAQE